MNEHEISQKMKKVVVRDGHKEDSREIVLNIYPKKAMAWTHLTSCFGALVALDAEESDVKAIWDQLSLNQSLDDIDSKALLVFIRAIVKGIGGLKHDQFVSYCSALMQGSYIIKDGGTVPLTPEILENMITVPTTLGRVIYELVLDHFSVFFQGDSEESTTSEKSPTVVKTEVI